MDNFANSNNQAANLKENYGSKKKKRSITSLSYADGGQVPQQSASQEPEGLNDYVGDMDPHSAIGAQSLNKLSDVAVQVAPTVGAAIDKNLDDYNTMVHAAANGDPKAQQQLAEHSLGMVMGSMAPVEALEETVAKAVKPIFTTERAGQAITPVGSVQKLQYATNELENPGFFDKIKQAKDMANKVAENPQSTMNDLRVAVSKQGQEMAKEGKIRAPKDPSNIYNGKTSDYVYQPPEPKLGEVEYEPGGIQKAEQATEPTMKDLKNLTSKRNQDIDKATRLKTQKKSSGMFAEGGEVPAGLDSFVNNNAQLGDSTAQAPSTSGSPAGLNDFLGPELKEAQFGSGSQQAITALEGAAQGYAGPLATAAEKYVLGVPEENIRARQEVNPITHGLAEAGGFLGSLATGTGEAALVGQAGEGVAKALGLTAKEAGLLTKIGATSTKAATEMALLQGGDEVSKMITNDPAQSLETAVTNVGLSGLIGGVGGAAIGAVAPLWKQAVGSKAGKFVEDFRSRINEHLTNPDPVSGMTDELNNYYKNIKDMSDEVYGPQGLKAQDIAKAMPEMSDKIMSQAKDTYDTVKSSLDTMIKKPENYPPRLASKLQMDLDGFNKAVSQAQNAGDVFNATQELKQTLQGYSKYDKFVKPVDEAYDFVKSSKDLAFNLRNSLEDPSVWGKAADRQVAINKAFKDFLPSLKDFEKKFTVQVGEDRQIDPAKISTYVNQLGKPNAEIKQQMLDNFLKASEKYEKVIGDTHSNLGIDNPIAPLSLQATKRTLDEVTPGAKMADAFIKNGLTQMAGHTIGGGAGAALGHMVGSPAIGAILGERALGPWFSSVLPAIINPILKASANHEGFKAAVDYAVAVANGEKLINRAAKNVFKAEAEILPESAMPKESDQIKLNKILKDSQVDTKTMSNMADNKLGYYLPQHNTQLAETSSRAMNYLNSLRANTEPKAPLDTKLPPNNVQKAEFSRALNIAQQPLLVLKSIKDGTVTPKDIQTLQTLYPSLYTRLSQKLTDSMTSHMNKASSAIPYKTRIGLSLFTGQPLDSTMSQQGIMAAQALSSPPSQQNQQPPTNVKHSTSTLSKMSGMYRTPGQNRQMDKQIKD